MTGYMIGIEAPEGEIEKIMQEIDQAQEKIYECYSKLRDYGVLSIKKDESTNKENDGSTKSV